MRLPLFLLTCLSLAVLAATAQDTTYFDAFYRKTDKASAALYQLTEVDASKQQLLEKTYTIDGRLVEITPFKNGKRPQIHGESVAYHRNGQIANRRQWKNGRAHGTFVFFDEAGRLRRQENYRKGERVAGKCFTASGSDTAFFNRNELPQFPGGATAKAQFVQQATDEATARGLQGRVKLVFVVGSDGRLSDFQISPPASDALRTEALRIAQSLPTYIPGRSEGQAVRTLEVLELRFGEK